MYEQWMDLLFPKPKIEWGEPEVVDKTPPPTYTVVPYDDKWEVLENGIQFPSALHDTKEHAEFIAAALNERRRYSETRRKRKRRYW